MHETISGELDAIVTRWTMGGDATPPVPAPWQLVVEKDENPNLALVALVGAYLGTVVVPEYSGQLESRQDIPRLPAQALSYALRPLATRVIGDQNMAHLRYDLLAFLLSRGRVMHPADWMPGQNERVPDIYASWQDWSASRIATSGDAGFQWDDYGPAERRRVLAEMRRRDPDAALAHIDENISLEKPEYRLSLLDIIAEGLDVRDQHLLQRLKGDRAPTVQTRAARLLARIGGNSGDSEDARELGEFFQIATSGLIRKTRTIAPKPLKTHAQRARRAELMQAVDYGAFARSIGLSEDELVSLWSWSNDVELDIALATMLGQSGPDDTVGMLAQLIRAGTRMHQGALLEIAPRLPADVRRLCASHVLAAGMGFFGIPGIAGDDPGLKDVRRHPAWRSLRQALARPDSKPTDQTEALLAFGLIVTPEEASAAIDELNALGIPRADPRLDTLRINSSLS